MEPPPRIDSDSMRDEKVKVLKSIAPLEPDDVVRGQVRGYRQEPGVAADSKVETFAALRLRIDCWRWQGVPFYIRAGKSLPVTCTEVVARLRCPPRLFLDPPPSPTTCASASGPTSKSAIGLNVMDPDGQGRQRHRGAAGEQTSRQQ